MTATHKRHNKKSRKSRKSKVVGKRGGDNRYYNNSNDSDRDSVDEGMNDVFTKLGIPNTDSYEMGQNGWLAIGVIGVIGVVLLGIKVAKGR
jgi:hypothetical protein